MTLSVTYINFQENQHLYSDNDSIKKLQKPDKIYMENTNLLYALTFKDVNKGTLREVFMVNQLSYLHRVEYCTRSACMPPDSCAG